MKTPKNGGADRVKAYRLRKKAEAGEELSTDEQAFLDSYPAGRSAASSRKVVHIEEEHDAAAEGDHRLPEEYAKVVTAEGLRADTLLRIVVDATFRQNEMYMQMVEHLLDRTTRIEEAHVSMLEAVREHYLARVDAEAQAQLVSEVAGDDNELASMLKFMLDAKANRDSQPKPKRKRKRRLGATAPGGG